MNTVDQQFTILNDKLQQVLKRISHLQKENAQLRTELHAAHEKETAAQAQVDELKQQASILKFAAGGLNDKDKKDFERTISRYIRQIDKCIAYLSR